MKKYLLAGMMAMIASTSWAQLPDPRDSIILESKMLASGLVGYPAFTMKVYITNKDTLAILTLGLRESTTVGNAYADLDSIGPAGNNNDGWTMGDCLIRLKDSFLKIWGQDFTRYDGVSPDRFLIEWGFSPTGLNPTRGSEPPNAVRSAIWELRFMSTDNALGEIRFDDTARYAIPTGFTILRNRGTFVQPIPVNFVPGVISVQQAPKGDLSGDIAFSPADVVWVLNCIMRGMPPPVGQGFCDLNCDGEGTIADIVLELNAVYREEEFPC